jgi:hypothetical protein
VERARRGRRREYSKGDIERRRALKGRCRKTRVWKRRPGKKYIQFLDVREKGGGEIL